MEIGLNVQRQPRAQLSFREVSDGKVSTQTQSKRLWNITSCFGDRLYMTTSFLGGCHQGRFIFGFNFSQLPSSWQVDPTINCSPFLICTEAVTTATILHSGETVSVTLALQLFAQLSTQLHCGHGGRPDIIVTRTVIKLRPEPTRPRESSRNHPVSQMHLCHRLLSPGKYGENVNCIRNILPLKVWSLLFSIVKIS